MPKSSRRDSGQPIVFVDTQFIPYGSFNNGRPGGPTQYDVNITYPIDISHKRKSKVVVARAAKSVLEAQYQDVVRRQIGSLSREFVDLQSARNNEQAARAAVREQERLLAKQHGKGGTLAATDVKKIALQLDKARSSLADSRDTLADAQEAMALVLNLPPEDASSLEPRGSLRDHAPPPPPLQARPAAGPRESTDLAAGRLGVHRAEAEVRLAHASRLDDVYLFYDPYPTRTTIHSSGPARPPGTLVLRSRCRSTTATRVTSPAPA